MNDVKKSIGWADYTWNPITGCKRGCYYCYARRIHDRFNKSPFSDIVFHHKRLREIEKLEGGEKIFVGSMSDIEYWPRNQTQKILDVCKMASGTTFMFLSKNPLSYIGFDWPKNTMQGLTLTGAEPAYEQRLMIFYQSLKDRPFLSIEPLLGILDNGNSSMKKMELVIVGAMTGPGAIPPKQEWIQSIKDNVPAEKIFWKDNIKKYL